jgi:hypothetical protein
LALCIIGLWANVYPPGSHLSRHAHGTGAAARQADGSGDRQAQRLEQQGRKESLLVLRMCPNGGSCPVEFAHGMSGTGVVEQMGDGDMYGLSREGQGAVEVPALRADGGLISARVGDCCLHHAVTDHTNPTSGPTFVSIMVKVTHRGNLEDLMAALSRLYLEQPLPAIVAAAAAGNAEPPSSSSSSSFPFLFPSPCPSVMNFARGVGMRGWQGLKRATEEQLAEWGVQLGPKAANASMLYCPAVVECLMVHQLLQNPTFAAQLTAQQVQWAEAVVRQYPQRVQAAYKAMKGTDEGTAAATEQSSSAAAAAAAGGGDDDGVRGAHYRAHAVKARICLLQPLRVWRIVQHILEKQWGALTTAHWVALLAWLEQPSMLEAAVAMEAAVQDLLGDAAASPLDAITAILAAQAATWQVATDGMARAGELSPLLVQLLSKMWCVHASEYWVANYQLVIRSQPKPALTMTRKHCESKHDSASITEITNHAGRRI